jgi:tricorn protease-like protein
MKTMGAIQTVSVGKAGSKPMKLSTDKGIFRTPSWSPDGKQIIYVKEEGNDHQGFLYSVKPGIYVISSTGGTPRFIRKSGSSPMFTPSNDAFYFFEDEGDSKSLKSVKLDESDLRTHFTSKYATSIVPSPDAKWVAFTELFKVYIASFPPSGKPTDLASGAKAFPVSQAAKDGGLSLHWSADSKALHWTAGDEYFHPENYRWLHLCGRCKRYRFTSRFYGFENWFDVGIR